MPIQQIELQEGVSSDSSGAEQLSADEVYDILSNQRRRFVLCYLLERGETTLRELSEVIAAWENGVDRKAVTRDQRKRVYTALHQTHLVRLDDHEVLEYERGGKSVRPRDRIDRFEPFLAEESAEDSRSDTIDVGLGLGTMLGATALLIDLPVLTTSVGAALLILIGVGVVVRSGLRSRAATDGTSPPTDLPGLRPEIAETTGE
jgi:hypothetical protein